MRLLALLAAIGAGCVAGEIGATGAGGQSGQFQPPPREDPPSDDTAPLDEPEEDPDGPGGVVPPAREPAGDEEPASDPDLVGFKFVYSGDSRNQHEESAATSRAMAALPGVRVAVSGGDVTDGDPLDDVVTSFAPLLDAGIPVVMAQGNHDDGGDEYLSFQSRYLGFQIDTKYWVYEATPRVSFIMLDSVQDLDEGSAQYSWFVAEVEACARGRKLCIPVNHHGHLNSEKDNDDAGDAEDLYAFAAAQPRTVVPFILSSHSHNVEVLAWRGMAEIVNGAWGTGSTMSRTMANDEVNPDTSCMGVSQLYAFFEIEVVSETEIEVTLRRQDGELVTPGDGIQPIPSDHVGHFVVPLDRPFECP